jgi:hypothetical protein
MNNQPPVTQNPAIRPKICHLSTISLVAGILSLISSSLLYNIPKGAQVAAYELLSIIGFSLLAGILALVCGKTALDRIKGYSGVLAGKGRAITGLVTGGLSVIEVFISLPVLY